MKSLFIVIAGFLSGIIGGMGMGGGTLLIPMLTIFFDIEQSIAQQINLTVFVPTALAAVIIYLKKNLINKRGFLFLIVPTLITSVAFSFFIKNLSAETLSKAYGWFLLVLGVFSLSTNLIKIVKK